jgi:hypothetical protein
VPLSEIESWLLELEDGGGEHKPGLADGLLLDASLRNFRF